MAYTREGRVIEPEIRPCINKSGGALGKGVLVKLSATPTQPFEVDHAAAVTDIPYGVTMEASAADGDIVNVQIRGVAPVYPAAAGIPVVGANITSDASGHALTAGNNEKVWGVVVGLAASATDWVEVELAGPCGGSPTHA